MADIERTLGAHGAKLENLERDVHDIALNIEKLLAAENQRRGGMKVVYAISATMGALGAAAAEAFFRK